jgi:Tol biopolymer transport system component
MSLGKYLVYLTIPFLMAFGYSKVYSGCDKKWKNVCVEKYDETKHGNYEIYSTSQKGVLTWWESGSKGIVESDIFIKDSEGVKRNLTNTPDMLESDPEFTPDGSKIVYLESRMIKNRGELPSDIDKYPLPHNICIMNSDGTGKRNLTNSPNAEEYEFTISPDGKKIAYMKLDASNSKINVLTSNLWYRTFESQPDIWMMNIDGSGKVNVTRTPDIKEGSPAFLTNNTIQFSAQPYPKRDMPPQEYRENWGFPRVLRLKR